MDTRHLCLEALPELVLDLICEYLACDAWRRHTLLAFSLTSRRCSEVAAVQRYKTVRIRITLKGSLPIDLNLWGAALFAHQRWRHVRKVVVGTPVLVNMDTAVSHSDEKELDEAKSFKKYARNCRILYKNLIDAVQPTPREKKRHERACRPLSKFIAGLPGLQDLVWSHPDPVPKCILLQLPKFRRVRLHVKFFCLRSLMPDRGTRVEVDPDDIALATSPFLYSITVTHFPFTISGRANYMEEAVQQMVTGAAPNLREVQMKYTKPGSGTYTSPLWRLPRPQWQGFVPVGTDSGPTMRAASGELSHLTLGGGNIVDSKLLEEWSERTHFPRLRSFTQEYQILPESLLTLSNMVRDGLFINLVSLSLQVRYNVCPGMKRPDLDQPLSIFLAALHPIKKLHLEGYISVKAFSATISHHATALRTLTFLPCRSWNWETEETRFVMDSQRIRQLHRACPHLTDLEILVPRTCGDTNEVRIYRALATFPHLDKLTLHLDCTNDITQGPNAGDPPQVVGNNAMRNMLINAAVDATLAQSIFSTVAQHMRLQDLTLLLARGPLIPDMEGILHWICRGWRCRRGPGMSSGISVQLLDEDAKRTTQLLPRALEDCDDVWVEAWLGIWPERGEGWRYDWASLPLAEED